MKMKRSIPALIAMAVMIITASSCSKDTSASTNNNSSDLVTTSTSATIAVAASASSSDSLYVIQPCGPGRHRDTVAQADLSSSITDYLSANYSGYNFVKAFKIVDTTGNIKGYVVIIRYNDRPVALLFDASGNFIKVLEQRERVDMDGHGWHAGGHFCDRDGMQHDSISLTALPAAILTYMATNYPQDTLVKAFKDIRDGDYMVITVNNGVYVTIFDSNGNFVKHELLPAPLNGRCLSIDQNALPTNSLSYLGTTYPNYVFKRAFKLTVNGTVQGYLAIIDANGTKYAVFFDANGNFVKSRTIH